MSPESRARKLVKQRVYSKARYAENAERERARCKALSTKKREAAAGRSRPSACEVCGGPPGKKALNFDHDHGTGEFRGWLCNGCNSALGHVGDDVEILEKLIVYLMRSRRPRLVKSL